jgi:ribonuclease T1
MRYLATTSANQPLPVIGVLAALVVIFLVACSGGVGDSAGAPSPTQEVAASATTAASDFAQEPPSDWNGGVIKIEALPPEARQTLALISTDGPYPYRQDGSTFQNREGLLPDREAGFYREFTVETPGSRDRGARRLVVGADLAAYYTADHYELFLFVAP